MAYPWPFDEFLLIFQGSPNLFGNPFQKNIKSVIILFDVPINLPSVCISIALLVNLQIQSQSIWFRGLVQGPGICILRHDTSPNPDDKYKWSVNRIKKFCTMMEMYFFLPHTLHCIVVLVCVVLYLSSPINLSSLRAGVSLLDLCDPGAPYSAWQADTQLTICMKFPHSAKTRLGKDVGW